MTEILVTWAKEILSVALLLPVMWWALRGKDRLFNDLLENQKEQSDKRHEGMMEGFKDLKTGIINSFEKTFHEHEKMDHEGMQKMTDAILDHDKNATEQFIENRKTFNKMAQSIGNTVLDNEQTVRLLLTEMWYVSDSKLEYVRILLKRNGLKVRTDSIKREIKDYLINKSEEYMKNFQTFITPVGDLSNWLNKHFSEEDFELFLEKIYTAFFKEYDETKLTKEAIIELKINEIQSIMRHLQRNLATKLKFELEDY